jgi:hypothetical protein
LRRGVATTALLLRDGGFVPSFRCNILLTSPEIDPSVTQTKAIAYI